MLIEVSLNTFLARKLEETFKKVTFVDLYPWAGVYDVLSVRGRVVSA